MEVLAHSEKDRPIVISWILDPMQEDIDLEVAGCGCGCDGGCGCGCGCTCSCSCSCDSTGANGDDNDSGTPDDDGGDAEDFSGPEHALGDPPAPESNANTTATDDESPVLSGCLSSAAGSSLGFDPLAAQTGKHYDPHGEEDFLTTGSRGLGEMSSPLAIPGTTAALGAALGDEDCQSTIVDAWNAVTDFVKEVGRQLDEADQAIQNGVNSIRDSLRN